MSDTRHRRRLAPLEQGRRRTGSQPAWESRVPLPLEAAEEATADGRIIRLPLRAEQVRVEKQTVIRERVVVRSRHVEEVARVAAPVRRERLRVETKMDADAERSDTEPRDAPRQPAQGSAGSESAGEDDDFRMR